jgi:hypothetical protein
VIDPGVAARVLALRDAGLAYKAIEREMGWPDWRGARAHYIVRRARRLQPHPRDADEDADAEPRAPADDAAPRPLRALAAAVLVQAMRDALADDAEAAAWVTDARAVELWAWAAGRAPRAFASRATAVLRRSRGEYRKARIA